MDERVGFERVGDGARIQDHRPLHTVVVGAGEQESRWPMVPAPGLIGVPVLGYDRVAAETVQEVGPIVVLDSQGFGVGQQLPACSTRSRS